MSYPSQNSLEDEKDRGEQLDEELSSDFALVKVPEPSKLQNSLW